MVNVVPGIYEGYDSESEFEELGEELLLIGKLRKKKKKSQADLKLSAGREEMILRQPMKSKGLLRWILGHDLMISEWTG